MLFDLIKQNNTKKFISYFEKNKNINVNSLDSNHNYLLSFAILNNNKKIVEFLLKNNARIDIYDNENRSILFIVIKYNMIDILNILLDYNKKAIGFDILFQADLHGLYPINYAILFRNEEITTILLSYMYGEIHTLSDSINKQIYDVLNNNLLIFSIKNKSFNLCKILTKYVNINETNSENNSALHEAVILNDLNTVKLLLVNNIDINIVNNSQKTCIYYVDSKIKNDILLLLLSKNININLQDILGNTIIHDLLIINNINDPNLNVFNHIYDILYLSESNNNFFNYNLINIDGNQPLHILLNYIKYNIVDDKIIDMFIKNTDLNIQNNDGITCLHLLLKNDIWKKKSQILCNKKLDIFIQNKENKKPPDFINSNDISFCFDIVTNSYINQLKNKNVKYINKIDIICSNNENKLNDENIQIFNEYINIKKFPKNITMYDICYEIIKKNILDYYNGISTTNSIISSYPISNNDLNVNFNLEQNKKIGINTFIGIKLDILFGILHVLNKHNNICYSPIYIDRKIYFDISWSDYKLEINEEIKKNILNFISNSKKRFMIIPIEIILNENYHNNYLLYDRKLNEFERFEPDGSHPPYGLNYDVVEFDLALEKFFNEINIKYISPLYFLPKIGLQRLEIQEKYTFFDSTKFCALWCIWYIDMRITYNSLDRYNFVNLLISTIKYKKMSFKFIIRTYSEKITKLRDDILNKINININDFVNGLITTDQYTNLHILIKNELKNYDIN